MKRAVAATLGIVLLVAGAALGLAALMAERRVAAEESRVREAQTTLLADIPRDIPPPVTRGGSRKAPVAEGVERGEALAVMRIPRFGPDWQWAVAEGVAAGVLADGPGHFPGTALPGARGNSAYAAHRAGHGDPFIDFDLLRPGDRILIAQGGTTWKYRVTTTPRIIDIDDVWILDPLPGRVLTLTTCWPKYGSSRRMFVRAALDSVDRG